MILAADFGGTTIKLGLVHEKRVLAHARLEVDAELTMAEQLEIVANTWEELQQKEGYTKRDCTGIALALPFLADPKHPKVRGEFGKFSGATTIDFGVWGRQRFDLPLVLENDLRLALLGEWAAGAAQGKSEVVMLAFGTGIGCAVIGGGQLLRGANNRAATLLGHGTISHEHSVGRCGNIGCAEDFASTATLGLRARAQPDFLNSPLSQARKIDFALLFDLATQDDACAQVLLQQSLKAWAVVVQNAVLAFDPEIVVLGGGILRRREIVLPSIQEHLRHYMPCLPLETPVVAAELGDDAALVGGEALFQKNQSSFHS